jgi:trimeric autotransporter adhesin
MRTRLLCFSLVFGLTLFSSNLFAQTAPIISYTAPARYTVGTAIPSLSPIVAGGAVAALAFGPGVALNGAALSNPYGMAVDPSRNIYVANYGNNTISEYNAAGTFIGTFGTGGTISNPAGLTFDNSGNAYILNYHRTNNGLGNHHGNGYVDQYSAAGAWLSSVVTGLGTATGITIDGSNNLYVAQGSYNGGNITVSQFNTTGALTFSLNNALIANPVGAAVDGAGNIYELDNTNNNVLKFDANGNYLSTFASGFINALGICTDGGGNIYVGDSGTHTVTVYDPSGTVLTTISGLTDPEGLVTDTKGNLYVSDYTKVSLIPMLIT